MNFTKPPVRLSPDVPAGYLFAEDMIGQMQRIQDMQLAAKQHNLSQYGGADFDALLKVMAEQVKVEILAMTEVASQSHEQEE